MCAQSSIFSDLKHNHASLITAFLQVEVNPNQPLSLRFLPLFSGREALRLSGTGFFMGKMPFLLLNQQCQSTGWITKHWTQPVAWPHPLDGSQSIEPSQWLGLIHWRDHTTQNPASGLASSTGWITKHWTQPVAWPHPLKGSQSTEPSQWLGLIHWRDHKALNPASGLASSTGWITKHWTQPVAWPHPLKGSHNLHWT